MKRIITLVIVITVIVAVLRSVFFVVDETQCVIATTFGKPVRTITSAGLYVKWPNPIQAVQYFDKRLQIFDPQPAEAFTLDRKNIVIDAFLLWKIEEPLRFLSKVGSITGAESNLAALLTSEINAELGKYELSDLISVETEDIKLGEIIEMVTNRCAGAAAQDYGIRVIRAGMKRINLPPENKDSVYKRMRAEREQKAREYRAEGQEQATVIRAKTDLEKRQILAEAYQQAQTSKGEGDAEALRIYADAYEEDPRFYKFMRTLDSYKKILKSDTTVLMSSDSALMKLLLDFDDFSTVEPMSVPEELVSIGETFVEEPANE
ncbi:MAG: protease modulator HflC [Candidatus Hydrogenedentes bacterium]|nr:protease modulator HflC [Candidatus Hydrogenedentota bacterium]